MTIDKLRQGESLQKEIIDVENELNGLVKWSETIKKKDLPVWIHSERDNYGETKIMCVLHGKKVLPLIQERIKEVKESLQDLKADFEEL